jgi:hypothetical protein
LIAAMTHSTSKGFKQTLVRNIDERNKMKINNKRIKIGDVFVISTKKGNAYLQFVYDNKNICELVRILPGLYQQQPDISKLVLLKEKYCIHFPIKGAAKKLLS